MDKFDQSKKEALVASSVQVRFLFKLKAGAHLPFKRQTLWDELYTLNKILYM